MLRLTKTYLLTLFYFVSITVSAQLPQSDGEQQRYSVQIEMPRGYISGISVMQREGELVKGVVVNEFGVTAFAFTYNVVTGKVRIDNVIAMLDKWYIRRVLRKDMGQVMLCLQRGDTVYENTRRKIKYHFVSQKFGGFD